MKTYTLSFADSVKHIPEKPELTARKEMSWSVQYQVWPNRKSLAKTVTMQRKRAANRYDWCPCVKLEDGEGY
jgi:hypothetical protein